MELERLSERSVAQGGADGGKSSGSSGSGGVDPQRTTSTKSLLSMEMEVDPTKQGDASFADSEANLYQLILTCQKIFSNIRDNMGRMPREFIQVFKALEYSINTKFGSEDAVYKAVGGFLFLRFIGAAKLLGSIDSIVLITCCIRACHHRSSRLWFVGKATQPSLPTSISVDRKGHPRFGQLGFAWS